MKRKVLQDFANVCCQRFLTSLSNSDRINFVIFGSGQVTMDFLSLRCDHELTPLSPLGYCVSFREWLEENCRKHSIIFEELKEVRLAVRMDVKIERLDRPACPGWLITNIAFECESRIATDEKEYFGQMSDTKKMGLGQILYNRYY
ncbi:hypothetical protein [Methylomonas methanica]|uniref:Uncharacterized protein n=1 Tax=Methylomonas methanica (strain DSM 25384 / MC09) TaxID=857087 RepID=G0A7H5_METMM|nr:hypothetical protein [Methylomonas methanica]AEG00645.1 hypothetical protein Metme_2241 [Methylomonas methanica MC09]